jgi:hypothetical protein
MRTKSLLVMLFVLAASVGMAQNDTTHKISNTQKTQAAKADVYIINSKKKIKDSFTTTFKDTSLFSCRNNMLVIRYPKLVLRHY